MTRREALVLGAMAAVAAGCGRAPRAARGACASLAGLRLRFIVPNAAGGGYDTESRLMKPLLEAALGAAIRIDNVAGAGGIIGARAIASAAPDGRTLGIVGVPGLLVSSLTGADAPDPARAFTILGRVSRSWHVWATGRDSGLASMADLVRTAAWRPLVVGINDVGSASVVSVAAAAAMLGLGVEFVGGFAGNRSASLAAIRHDVDLVCFNYETIRDLILAGDLRPLLQISARPISSDEALAGVPVLGGPDGWAARSARAGGRDPGRARADADALTRVIGAGRIVVAPAALPVSLAGCLKAAVTGVLEGRALAASTRRALDPASGDEAARDVHAARTTAEALVPVMQATLAGIRGTP